MNDGGYGGRTRKKFDNYFKGLQGMADQAKEAKIRVAWVTPQPLDVGEPGKTDPNKYNPTLEKFSEDGVKEIAKKNDGLYVDQFHPYLAVLNKARGEMDKYNRITAGDAVHPGFPGQSLMAASILKGLSMPSLVASVEIDAASKKATAKNAKVTDVAAKDGGNFLLAQADQAVPFFPPEAASILKWTPILDELNDYRLKVTGLKDGKYAVSLGGKKAAEYSSGRPQRRQSGLVRAPPRSEGSEPGAGPGAGGEDGGGEKEQILPRSGFQRAPGEGDRPLMRSPRIWSRNAWLEDAGTR